MPRLSATMACPAARESDTSAARARRPCLGRRLSGRCTGGTARGRASAKSPGGRTDACGAQQANTRSHTQLRSVDPRTQVMRPQLVCGRGHRCTEPGLGLSGLSVWPSYTKTRPPPPESCGGAEPEKSSTWRCKSSGSKVRCRAAELSCQNGGGAPLKARIPLASCSHCGADAGYSGQALIG